MRKAFVGRRPRTYLSLTAQGRAALAAHLKALWQIAGDVSGEPVDSPAPE